MKDLEKIKSLMQNTVSCMESLKSANDNDYFEGYNKALEFAIGLVVHDMSLVDKFIEINSKWKNQE